jgi:hypothetical protein
LTTNWNFDARSFGRSAGLAPLRILSTKKAVWRSAPFQWPWWSRNAGDALWRGGSTRKKGRAVVRSRAFRKKWTILS